MSESLLSVKIIVVGNGTVGKSSMTQRFAKGSFTEEYKKTLGCDFLMKRRVVGNIEIEFLIWDTAGQEYYDSITKRYYRGAQAAVLVFSVDNRESFDAIPKWKDKVFAECGSIPMILVKNKIDLSEHLINEEEANNLASKVKLNLFNVSVKDNIFVNNVFDSLALQIISDMKDKEMLDRNGELKDQFNSNIMHMGKNPKQNLGLTAKNIIKDLDNKNNKNDGNGIDLDPKKKKKKKFFC